MNGAHGAMRHEWKRFWLELRLLFRGVFRRSQRPIVFQVSSIRDGDLLILKTSERMTPEMADALKAAFSKRFNGRNETIVIDGSIDEFRICHADAKQIESIGFARVSEQ